MTSLKSHKDNRLQAWLDHALAHDPMILRAQLADDAIFLSPVVHTPQQGIDKVFAYLDAAGQVFANARFRYTQFIVDGDTAVLEFEADLDDIHVNGVDIIHWNADGNIDRFKVMVRPIKALNMLWQKMAERLSG